MSLYLIKFANSAYFAYTYKQIFSINFINYIYIVLLMGRWLVIIYLFITFLAILSWWLFVWGWNIRAFFIFYRFLLSLTRPWALNAHFLVFRVDNTLDIIWIWVSIASWSLFRQISRDLIGLFKFSLFAGTHCKFCFIIDN